jgi:diguanylate cyclase (GGDEF)-like protein
MHPSPISPWWGRLALRAKVLLVAAIPLVALAAAVPALFLTERAAERTGDAIEHVYQTRQALARVVQDLVDAENSARGYLLTRDARFTQPYQVGVGSVRGDFVRLRGQLADAPASTQESLDSLDQLIDQRLELLRRLVAYAEASDEGTIPDGLLASGKRAMDELRAEVAGLDASQGLLLEARRADLRRARSTALAVSAGVVPLALLGTIVLVVVFGNGLVRRVRRIERNAHRLETGEALDLPEPGTDELARLDATLQHAAGRIAEQDAELRELALVDPLTGLHNRRGFLEIAEHELQVCQRRGSATALLFVDVDGLKVVNDHHGHGLGDRMLRTVAEVLRGSTRDADLVARVGGDEFCVLLTPDSAVDATALLDRLTTTLAAWNARKDLPFELAFSVGVGLFDPAEPVSVEELIERADVAMYENKRAKTEMRSGV